MFMFVKRVEKAILNENFEEAIKVENVLLSMHGKVEIDDEKPSVLSRKTGTQIKTPSDKKYQEFTYMESMVKIIKKMFNDVINLKKMASKNASRNISKPPFRCYVNPSTSETLTPMKEAHLGQRINFIKSNHNNAKDPKEEVEDLEQGTE